MLIIILVIGITNKTKEQNILPTVVVCKMLLLVQIARYRTHNTTQRVLVWRIGEALSMWCIRL